ncbi:G-type lectin S-receptor-like serine/threonine-protein kinase LECRK3 [Amborella trichopoda]|nr:G-type lectin S-receptor-like serine/threonine-protein kinase LECRK3 [Amborella trichopoda]|eukprot:XP_006850036.2 G-type lectin S-receptor-like serine/threonine-protein kinase LECRK3 [Amborella trichopoda]
MIHTQTNHSKCLFAHSNMAPAPLLTLIFFLYLPLLSLHHAFAQSNTNITQGTTLSSSSANNSYRTSPSGDFAFGFYSIEGNQFLVGIWFHKIPERTLVWSANRDQPVQSGSTIQLTLDGRLGFTDSKGLETWIYNQTTGVSSGAMLDTGNFILVDSVSSILWQSFENPTDTLLPGQTFGQEKYLYSNRLEGDYRTGRFMLVMQVDGNLVLYPKGRRGLDPNGAYYASRTDGASSPVRLVFDRSGVLHLTNSSDQVIANVSSNALNSEDFYLRATIDSDGFFRLYSRRRNSNNGESWIVVSKIPNDRDACGVSGACGPNAYCVLQQDKAGCLCPQNFSFIDAKYAFDGCKQDFNRGCSAYLASDYTWAEYENVDWPTGDYERLDVNEDKCKEVCMNDCLCDLAITRNNDCWKKRMPVTEGRKRSSIAGKALFKVPLKSGPLERTKTIETIKKEDGNKTMVLVSWCLMSFSAILFILSMAAIAFAFKKGSRSRFISNNVESIEANLVSFKYAQLQEATNGFKELLGNGAYGSVYKGIMDVGREVQIAVKRLDKVVERGEKEFRTELHVIGRTHHKNLVRLLGFCDEGDQRLLIYEFMPNGSLADFLFGPTKPSWSERIQLAFGIARGITYLHEECETPIIHCDIKPQNILLDEFRTPKISDFGLAKLLQHNQTHTTTGIRGTRGYVAPEWFRNVSISTKVDVYSFGVVLLDIICCMKKSDHHDHNLEVQFVLSEWVYDCFFEGKVHELVEGDDAALGDLEQVERMVKVGLWCIQEDPSMRPSMKKVVQMLEGTIEVLAPPDSSTSWL